MKQPSAIGPRLWATTANASRKATSSVRKLWSFLAVLTLLMLSSALPILGATQGRIWRTLASVLHVPYCIESL